MRSTHGHDMHLLVQITIWERHGRLHMLPFGLNISLLDRDSELAVLGPHKRQ
jgi:hypothetical protein